MNKTVKQINLPLGEYVVFGSGPMAAYGIRQSNDIDLFVTSKLYASLKTDGWKVNPRSSGGEYLSKDNVEVYDTWEFGQYNPTPEQVIAQAVMLNGVPYAPLSEIMAWKKAFGRKSDISDIALIELYLAKNPVQTFADGLRS